MEESERASQEELVAILQSIHTSLRRAFHVHGAKGQGHEWEEAWKTHTANDSVLQSYSSAMQRLAKEIWEPRHTASTHDGKTKSRLEWIRLKSLLYFGLGPKLETLDVGSCYNPLAACDLFEVTPIVLCPAPGCEEEVKVCDFLHVDLSDDIITEGNRITSLPKSSFSVVVFSFFLEYLPDPKQRMESCRRAQELLEVGGLLFILRPDSNPANQSNSKQIKQLKVGCALLGLRRVFCEKMEHFWGMAFAKITETERMDLLTSRRFIDDCRKINFQLDLCPTEIPTAFEHLFPIPQDSRDWSSQPAVETVTPTTSEGADPLLLAELPEMGSESDCD